MALHPGTSVPTDGQDEEDGGREAAAACSAAAVGSVRRSLRRCPTARRRAVAYSLHERDRYECLPPFGLAARPPTSIPWSSSPM